MRHAFLPIAALTLVFAACTDRGEFSEESFSSDPATGEVVAAEADRYAIHSRNGEVKLGLTDEHVYFRLSDETLAEIEADMERDTAEQDGLGGAIASAVTKGVSDLLRNRLQYPVENIRDLHYEDGQFRITFADGTDRTPEMTSGDGGTPLFRDGDAERFVSAFRKLKREQGE